MDTLELSLYLHIPFCTEKCDYCDFYSVPYGSLGNTTNVRDRFIVSYIEALLKETEQRLHKTAAENNASILVPSIYIGGGTPSLLGAPGITHLLGGLKQIIGSSYNSVNEITIEANPETTDSAFLQSCALNGITRLSLGIQSFDEKVLKAAGRQGRPLNRKGLLHKRLSEAREIFGRGLSLDLISGLPGYNENILKEDMDKALSYEPGHISLYALTVEEGTPIARRKTDIPSGESADLFWVTGRDTLKKAGYEQYEVSNFALSQEYRCIHNIRYWQMKNWIGVGPAASGTIIKNGDSGIRITYTPDINMFITAFQNRTSFPVLVEYLDKKAILKETLMMGFRYCKGPDPILFVQRFGKKIEETIPHTLLRWKKRNRNFSLQEIIMNYLNGFLLDAFSELDNTILSV